MKAAIAILLHIRYTQLRKIKKHAQMLWRKKKKNMNLMCLLKIKKRPQTLQNKMESTNIYNHRTTNQNVLRIKINCY